MTRRPYTTPKVRPRIAETDERHGDVRYDASELCSPATIAALGVDTDTPAMVWNPDATCGEDLVYDIMEYAAIETEWQAGTEGDPTIPNGTRNVLDVDPFFGRVLVVVRDYMDARHLPLMPVVHETGWHGIGPENAYGDRAECEFEVAMRNADTVARDDDPSRYDLFMVYNVGEK